MNALKFRNRIGILIFLVGISSFPTPGLKGGFEVILIMIGALMFLWGSTND